MIASGDEIRYKQTFLSARDGINCPFADIAEMTGVVTEIFHHGIAAKIRWDNGRQSSSLLKNIEKIDSALPATTPEEYRQTALRQRVERAGAAINLLIDHGFIPTNEELTHEPK